MKIKFPSFTQKSEPKEFELLHLAGFKVEKSIFDAQPLKGIVQEYTYIRKYALPLTLISGLGSAVWAAGATALLSPYLLSNESRRAVTQINPSYWTYTWKAEEHLRNFKIEEAANFGLMNWIWNSVKLVVPEFYHVQTLIATGLLRTINFFLARDKREINAVYIRNDFAQNMAKSPLFWIAFAALSLAFFAREYLNLPSQIQQGERRFLTEFEKKLAALSKELLQMEAQKAKLLAENILSNQEKFSKELDQLQNSELTEEAKKIIMSPLIQAAKKITQLQKEGL